MSSRNTTTYLSILGIHKIYKSARGLGHSKGHYCEFIRTIPGSNGIDTSNKSWKRLLHLTVDHINHLFGAKGICFLW